MTQNVPPTGQRIVVIDDEAAILRTVGEFLRDEGHEVWPFTDPAEGLRHVAENEVDIVISDIKMPGHDGFEVLSQVRATSPQTETILITGHGDIASAVRALREGAFDFFTKPISLRDLMFSLQRTTRFNSLRRETDRYRESLSRIRRETGQQYHLDQIVGSGPGIAAVKELIQVLQQTDTTTVMVVGESGTGKELVARAIHYGSRRAELPFVSVNCTALPETLIEAELYGHERGAFTDARESRKGQFEQAEGGSLFLDEIGDMSLTAQAKVLRTIEEREVRRVGGTRRIPVDVRLISATNKDLRQSIEAGSFREDLYYRLNTFVIRVPALRERPEDIPSLAEHFVDQFSREMRKEARLLPATADALCAMPFPGNVRELRNLMERAVILSPDGEIQPEHLIVDPPSSRPSSSGRAIEDLSLESMEKTYIQEAMTRTGGNQVRAARLLGISRDALRRRLQAYDLLHRDGEESESDAAA